MLKKEIRQSICNAVLNTTPAESITIFGSFARDEERKDSDIDLCVITDENKKTIEIMTNLRLALSKVIDKPLDLVVYPKKVFESRIKTGYTFETTISKEGIRIYG